MVCPVVTVHCETWTLSESDENQLRRFQRKVLRRIFCAIKEGDAWRIMKNEALNTLIDGGRCSKIHQSTKNNLARAY